MNLNPFERVSFRETHTNNGVEYLIEFFDGTIIKGVKDPVTNDPINSILLDGQPVGQIKNRNNRKSSWKHPTIDDGLTFETFEQLSHYYGLTVSSYYRMKKRVKTSKDNNHQT